MAVSADNHRVADDVGVEAHLAAHDIGEHDVALRRHAEADRGPLAGGYPLGSLLVRETTARPGVSRREASGERFLALRVELRGRAEAVVGRIGAEQFLGVRLIQVQALRIEAEPAQIAQDRGFRLARRSLGIGVFDAQDEGAGGAAGEQPVEQRGPRVANVQLACGTRCESDSHVIWNHEFGIWNAFTDSKFLLLTAKLLVSTR